MSDDIIMVAIYERVSSDEQREKESIKTQMDANDAYLAAHPDLRLYRRYQDDGVSGTIAFDKRPHGGDLVRDARAGRFKKIIFTRPNRVGRKATHILNAVEIFDQLEIELVGSIEDVEDRFILGIKAVVAEEERRTLIDNSSRGMERAAREGRYCGGICPIGYKVVGEKQHARLAISDEPMWHGLTESGVVRQIFDWSAAEGWSARRIADHMNTLGVPTAYQQAGRSVRKQRTRGEWTPGRVRQILRSTVYKGEYVYGKRSKNRTPISALVPRIVSDEVWGAAQRTLERHYCQPQDKANVFLLKSRVRCGVCGRSFCGTKGRGVTWYRCNGQIAYRGKCGAKSIDGRVLEPLVRDDLLRWLNDPGDVIGELVAEQQADGVAAVAESERIMIESALVDIGEQRRRALDAYTRGRATQVAFDSQMDDIEVDERRLRERLASLEPVVETPPLLVTDEGLLREIRERVRNGLSEREMQEICSLLVRRVTVHTERIDGKKVAKVVVEYNFAVSETDTGTGSSRRRA